MKKINQILMLVLVLVIIVFSFNKVDTYAKVSTKKSVVIIGNDGTKYYTGDTIPYKNFTKAMLKLKNPNKKKFYHFCYTWDTFGYYKVDKASDSDLFFSDLFYDTSNNSLAKIAKNELSYYKGHTHKLGAKYKIGKELTSQVDSFNEYENSKPNTLYLTVELRTSSSANNNFTSIENYFKIEM